MVDPLDDTVTEIGGLSLDKWMPLFVDNDRIFYFKGTSSIGIVRFLTMAKVENSPGYYVAY